MPPPPLSLFLPLCCHCQCHHFFPSPLSMFLPLHCYPFWMIVVDLILPPIDGYLRVETRRRRFLPLPSLTRPLGCRCLRRILHIIYSQPLSNPQSPPSNQTSTSSSISFTKTNYQNASNVILLTSTYSVSTRTPTTQPNSAPSASQQQSDASLQATMCC